MPPPPKPANDRCVLPHPLLRAPMQPGRGYPSLHALPKASRAHTQVLRDGSLGDGGVPCAALPSAARPASAAPQLPCSRTLAPGGLLIHPRPLFLLPKVEVKQEALTQGQLAKAAGGLGSFPRKKAGRTTQSSRHW